MSSTFKRFEYKYKLNKKQYDALLETMLEHMKLDEFGRHTINNIYFDTPDFLLIRRSLDKPVYKEKLRLRWYGKREEDTPIFIELKKKYKGVVYKRRIKHSWEETKKYFINGEKFLKGNKQITNELDYFVNFYKNLGPAVFLGYERDAYYGIENDKFRMTFDFNIRCQENDVLNQKMNNGTPVIKDDCVLLEVKTAEGLPQWLLSYFADQEVYRSSFSKYGTAYKEILLPKKNNEHNTLGTINENFQEISKNLGGVTGIA